MSNDAVPNPMIAPLEIADVFSAEECRKIIETAVPEQFGSAVLVGGKHELSLRRADICWLDEVESTSWIFDRLVETFAQSNRCHFKFQIEEFAERMQVSRYSAAQSGFFDWHVDVGGGAAAGRRKLTMVIQLSDGASYEGGQLELNSDGSIRASSRKIGTALVLPSFVLHRVRPVLSGDRFSLTLWSHGPAFS